MKSTGVFHLSPRNQKTLGIDRHRCIITDLNMAQARALRRVCTGSYSLPEILNMFLIHIKHTS